MNHGIETEQAGAEAPIEELASRITDLENAFRRFAEEQPGLSVDIVGHVTGNDELVHPAAGFTVELEGSGAGGVSLYVTAGYGELTRWREPGRTAAGALREQFRVSLFDGFLWGDTTFPNAEALAHDLIGYMHYNLDSVA